MQVLAATATPAAAAQLRPSLRLGSRSPAVVYVQTTLGVKPASGYYGPITAKAVRAAQSSHGLKATGKVTASTWKVLLRSASTSAPAADPAPEPPERPPAAPTPEQAAEGKPALGHGSRGPAVVFVQEKLGVAPATGYYGALTRGRREHAAGASTTSRSPARWVRPPGRSCWPPRASSSCPSTHGQPAAPARRRRRPRSTARSAAPPALPAPAALTPEQAAAARPLLTPRHGPRRPGRGLRPAVPAGVAGHRVLRQADDRRGHGLPGGPADPGHRHGGRRHLGGHPHRAHRRPGRGAPDDAHAPDTPAAPARIPTPDLHAAGEPDRGRHGPWCSPWPRSASPTSSAGTDRPVFDCSGLSSRPT